MQSATVGNWASACSSESGCQVRHFMSASICRLWLSDMGCLTGAGRRHPAIEVSTTSTVTAAAREEQNFTTEDTEDTEVGRDGVLGSWTPSSSASSAFSVFESIRLSRQSNAYFLLGRSPPLASAVGLTALPGTQVLTISSAWALALAAAVSMVPSLPTSALAPVQSPRATKIFANS